MAPPPRRHRLRSVRTEGLDRRRLAVRRRRRREHRSALELALLDTLEQHADVFADVGLVDRLTEHLNGVDASIEGAVDLHGVADTQRATLHAPCRNGAA